MYVFDSEKFKEERVRQGWSYGEFAKELQKYATKAASKSMIHAWENRSAMPNSVSLMAICRVLQKEPKFFMKYIKEKK